MDEKLKANRAHWNDLVPIHSASSFYDVEGFKAGRSNLDRLERAAVDDPAGKSLLHLQCHFGMTTLSWAQLGARATGVDFSPQAIDKARELSRGMDVEAEFICSDIYELPRLLDRRFDVVFASYGVLCWLPDLERWAEVVSHFLEPGGTFCLVEGHPFSQVFADEKVSELKVHYPYFARQPLRWDEQGSYADRDAIVEHTVCYEWTHRLSDIINSLIKAGLRIVRLDEHPFSAWQALPFMVKDDEGFWRLPDGEESVPLTLSLWATK